jgi:integrase/recombinase XerD
MALARGATGPLSPHLEAFVTSLIDQRYSVICVRANSWRAAAFDTWLAEQGVDLADLGDAHIDEFHRRDYRPRSDCRAQPRKHESFALGQLLQYLRGQGLCAAVDSIKVPADALVASFEQFLRRDRGLAAGSIRGYRTSARDFLIHRFGSQSVDLSAVSATDIVGFVRQQARSLRPRGLKNVITALRAFLRFARYRGEIDAALSRAATRVPRSAGATGRSCCCCRAWVCEAARSSRCCWRTSIGTPAACACVARTVTSASCHCRPMSVRPSLPTCGMAGPRAPTAICFCAHARRSKD